MKIGEFLCSDRGLERRKEQYGHMPHRVYPVEPLGFREERLFIFVAYDTQEELEKGEFGK